LIPSSLQKRTCTGRIVTTILSGAFLFNVAASHSAQAQESVAVGPFSSATSIEAAGWKPMQLPKIDAHTEYGLVEDGSIKVLTATANASMSGISHKVDIDPTRTPIIEFRFRVDELPKGADIKTKAGDDFAARIYVMFDFDINKLSFADRTKIRIGRRLYGDVLPTAALNYVWDSKYPVGEVIPNAYTDRVRAIVVESGASKLGQWVSVRRNVAEDFKTAFGDVAPRIIGVAIATDADNTKSSARARYGDIRFTAP
jgi:Protein of unknown function (DUF3047)